MVIQATKDLLNRFKGPQADKTNPNAGSADRRQDATATSDDKTNPKASGNLARKISAAKKPEPPTLNIDSHKHFTSIDDIKDEGIDLKSAEAVLAKYKADKNQTQDAFLSEDKKTIMVHVPAEAAAKRITNSGFFANLFKAEANKVNSALTRIKNGNEINLVSFDSAPTSPKHLQKLTKEGVYSYMAVHQADEKGKFNKKDELLVPVMDLEAMLNNLEKKPPKGIKGEMLKAFKADIESLKANSKLQNIKFIDTALAHKMNKEKFENEDELRKALCNVVDNLSLNSEVFVSGDLLAKGDEAKANGKIYQAIDFHFPVIDKEGKVSTVEHPLTLVRREDRRSEALPPEINKVIQWHFMSEIENPSKIDHSGEAMQTLQKSFVENAESIKTFDQAIAA